VFWEWSSKTSPSAFRATHYYVIQQGPQAPELLQEEDYPWYAKEMISGRTVVVSSINDLPNEASRDRESCLRLGIRNTFDTGGICPACPHQWTDTQCLSCSHWSPHSDRPVTGFGRENRAVLCANGGIEYARGQFQPRRYHDRSSCPNKVRFGREHCELAFAQRTKPPLLCHLLGGRRLSGEFWVPLDWAEHVDK
jgi:hypothetical protein